MKIKLSPSFNTKPSFLSSSNKREENQNVYPSFSNSNERTAGKLGFTIACSVGIIDNLIDVVIPYIKQNKNLKTSSKIKYLILSPLSRGAFMGLGGLIFGRLFQQIVNKLNKDNTKV